MKAFYEKLGLTFVQEKHGSGHEHLVTKFSNGVVLEIYPGEKSKGGIGFETTRFDDLFFDTIRHSLEPTLFQRNGRRVVFVRDPDGRRVEILEASNLSI